MKPLTIQRSLRMAAITGGILAVLVILRALLFGYDDAATGAGEMVVAIIVAALLVLQPVTRLRD